MRGQVGLGVRGDKAEHCRQPRSPGRAHFVKIVNNKFYNFAIIWRGQVRGRGRVPPSLATIRPPHI